MGEAVAAVVSWPNLVLALLIFGLAPSLLLRLAVSIYPVGHPRRQERVAELAVVPTWERPFWVAGQLIDVFTEGGSLRRAAWRESRAQSQADGTIATPPGGVRSLVPLAAAAALIVVSIGGVSVGAADARPGDLLWEVSRVLYSERAGSLEAATLVEKQFDLAKAAINRGESQAAASALVGATELLNAVRAEEGRAEMAEVQAFLQAKIR